MPAADSLIGEATLASAATVDLGSVATEQVAISGTTTVTSFGSSPNRAKRLRFLGALTLTYNATSLVLPGLANIVTAAGDTCVAASDAAGNWMVLSYQRASGKPTVLPSAADLGLGASNTPSFAGLSLSGTVTYSVTSSGPVVGAAFANLGGGDAVLDFAPNINGPGVRSAQVGGYAVSASQTGLVFKVANGAPAAPVWRMDNLGAFIPASSGNRPIGSATARVSATWTNTLILAPGIGTTQTPVNNGDVTVEITSNTLLTWRLKGSDGTVRSVAITLA